MQSCPIICIRYTVVCPKEACAPEEICSEIIPGEPGQEICIPTSTYIKEGENPCYIDWAVVTFTRASGSGTYETFSLTGTNALNFINCINGTYSGPSISAGSFYNDCNGNHDPGHHTSIRFGLDTNGDPEISFIAF